MMPRTTAIRSLVCFFRIVNAALQQPGRWGKERAVVGHGKLRLIQPLSRLQGMTQRASDSAMGTGSVGNCVDWVGLHFLGRFLRTFWCRGMRAARFFRSRRALKRKALPLLW